MQQNKMLKHKKLRNTGLIFELLSGSIIHEALCNQKPVSIGIVKRHFKEGSELYKELNLYLSLQNKTENDPNQLMELAVNTWNKLDKVKLEQEKYNLIKDIKKVYNLQEFFKPRTNKYKLTASIYKLFENSNLTINPDDYLSAKNYITEHLKGLLVETVDEVEQTWMQQDPEIRRIAFKIAVKTFNERYNNLSERPKKFIAKYLNEDYNSDSFRTYLQDEIKYITENVQRKIGRLDESEQEKTENALTLLSRIATAKIIKEEHLEGVIQFYELLEEI